jgi:hypothetical protein
LRPSHGLIAGRGCSSLNKGITVGFDDPHGLSEYEMFLFHEMARARLIFEFPKWRHNSYDKK